MTPKRIDDNQPEIVKAYRDLGREPVDIHELGKGKPDILIPVLNYIPALIGKLIEQYKSGDKYFWTTDWREIKSLTGKLTPDEKKFHEAHPGLVKIIGSVEEVAKEFGE